MPNYGNRTYGTPVFSGAAVFWVDEGGSLESIMLVHNRTQTENKAQTIFSGRGCNISVGQQIRLTYNGEIVFGFGLRQGEMLFRLTSDTKYLITVVGDGALAGTVVVAS